MERGPENALSIHDSSRRGRAQARPERRADAEGRKDWQAISSEASPQDPAQTKVKPRTHLRIASSAVPVRDLGRSVEFYRHTLGFRLLGEGTLPSGDAFAAVAPSDGTAVLLLSKSDPHKRHGTFTGISFVTTDLATQHQQWSERGVRFTSEPRPIEAKARFAVFFDLDGNGFLLGEVDSITEVDRKSVV